jgi:hypothetical protein
MVAMMAALPPERLARLRHRRDRDGRAPRRRTPYRPPVPVPQTAERLLDTIRGHVCRHRGARTIGHVYECDGPDTRIKLCTTNPACPHARRVQVCQRCDHHLPDWPFRPTRSSSPATIGEALERDVLPAGWSGWPHAAAALAGRSDAGIGPNQRHLLYFVYPRKWNGRWQKNVRQLLRRIDLFDGRRVVAVVTDDKTDSVDEVRAAFAGHRCEFLRFANVVNLREVVAWLPLWERVAAFTGPRDYTFFAHAKGVTRSSTSTAHKWTTLMYEANLDYWPVVERLFETYPIVGSLKKNGHRFNRDRRSDWIYVGTFYWVRNRDFFTRDWRSVEQEFWGTEYMPGVLYSSDEAGVVYGEGGDEMAPGTLTRFIPILEGWNEWKSANITHRTGTGTSPESYPADSTST